MRVPSRLDVTSSSSTWATRTPACAGEGFYPNDPELQFLEGLIRNDLGDVRPSLDSAR